MILDTNIEVFVWVGQSVDPKEKQTAFEIGEVLYTVDMTILFQAFRSDSSFFVQLQKYVQMAVSLEGRSQETPLYRVTEGNEPSFFTTYFSWDPAKAIVCASKSPKLIKLFVVGTPE